MADLAAWIPVRDGRHQPDHLARDAPLRIDRMAPSLNGKAVSRGCLAA
jgi:hypothetical protein